MNGTIAGAPVSFGVFELTPEGQETIGPDTMLETLVEAGYRGVDLGPEGFLGEGAELRRRLDRFGMALAGGWIQLPFSDDEAFAASISGLRRTLAAFQAAAESGPARLPKPTLADDGSTARRAAPGRGAAVDPLADEGWRRLVRNADAAAAIVREAGFAHLPPPRRNLCGGPGGDRPLPRRDRHRPHARHRAPRHRRRRPDRGGPPLG